MAAQAPPVVRGFMCKMLIGRVRRLPAEQQRQIFARVPGPVLELIEASPKLGWVSHEEILKVVDVLHQVMGDAPFRQFISGTSEELLTYPLLQSFFDGAIQRFGLTPQALLKWAPYAWEQVYHHSGRFVYRLLSEPATGGKVEMVLEDCPSLLLSSGSLVEVIGGTLEMFLRRAARRGHVELTLLDKERGRARYEISWDGALG